MKNIKKQTLLIASSMTFIVFALVCNPIIKANACDIQLEFASDDIDDGEAGPKVHKKHCNGECNNSGKQCRIR